MILFSSYFSRVSILLFNYEFSFWSKDISCEAFSMASSIMLFSLSLLFFISYYNICLMSFEFNSKIQSLTNKLQGLSQNSKKQTQIENVKESLRKLNEYLQRQLTKAQKRIFRIESKLDKCEDYSKRSSRAIETVWNDKEQKVGEIIGVWVDQYQEKAEQVRNQIMREEMSYKIKLQQEQQVIAKQMRMQQNRIKDLIRILEKQINKLNTINSQNQTTISKEISGVKITISEGMANADHIREDKLCQVQLRMGKLKQNIKNRCRLINEDISAKSTKLKQVMKLLLEIE